MHRYRLETVYLEYDNNSKPKNDTPKGYVLVDENGDRKHKEWVDPYKWVSPSSDEWVERFERAYFETPEDAWSAIPEDKRIPPETPLYRYHCEMKEPAATWSYTSLQKVEPGEKWLTFETLNGSLVKIDMSEVRHFRRDEI